MKKRLVLLSIFALFSSLAFAGSFNEARSTHFIVLYQKAPEEFVKKVLDKAEFYYEKITEDLGFRRFDFWLWDNRAKIYIYDDVKSYQAVSGQPSWSGGAALPHFKIIQTFVSADNFLDTILPHEMGHIIFRELVGFNNPAVPLWLEEGVASYQEKAKYSQAKIFIRKAVREGNFMDLNKLSSFYTVANLDPKVVNIFYAESFSIVDFLIENFGRDNFVLFCQNLRDYRDFKKSLRLSYSLDGLNELNSVWLDYLNK
jgi:hypothetical protein